MMVPLDNARLFFRREICIDSHSDHSRIAKLRRSESGIYPDIRWAIQRTLHYSANERALLMMKKGNHSEAEAILMKALNDRGRVLGSNHLDTLLSKQYLGRALSSQQKHSEAETMFRQAAEGREKVLGSGHSDTLESKYCLGSVLYYQQKHSEAEAMFKQAAEGREKVLGSDDSQTLASKHWLGLALYHRQQRGRYLVGGVRPPLLPYHHHHY